MSVRIRVLHTLDECRAIRDDWHRLVRLETNGVVGFDVSASFEWTEALWQELLHQAPQQVLVAEDESGIRGLLPCRISSETTGRIRHRMLSPISSLYDLRTGFLVGGDVDVLDMLLGHALEHLGGWDTFVFKVVDTSPSDAAVREVLRRRGIGLAIKRQWNSPVIALPADATQVLASLKPNMRSNVRRREKQLQALGKLEVRLYETEASVPGFLQLMESVEDQSWKLEAGTAMTTSIKQKNLYRIVTPALVRHGWFLGAALLLDERPLAFIYGFPFEGVFVDEKESFVEEFKEYGPGNVLKARFLEELVRREILTFDYAGSPDPHKARWTDASYSRHIYVLYNRTLRGQLVRASVGARKWLGRWRQPKAS